MTAVFVYSYTHSVTYVADNILKSLKDIVRLSGLDPSKLTTDWDTHMRGMRTWLGSEDLKTVQLEIFDPKTDRLVLRWDIDIVYGWNAEDGNFWTDTDQLRYHILKAGAIPSLMDYRLLLHTKPGRPDVDGWSSATLRSTSGMVKQSLGSTIHHSGLDGQTGYWRKS